jgi:hypothetical protein
MKLNGTIHAEAEVSEAAIEATELGLLAALNQTGLRLGVQAVRLSVEDSFPTLANGQVSDAVIAGHPVWDGGGPNVWLTNRDLTHYDGSTKFIYGVAGSDGHMAISTHRLDLGDKDNPMQLFTTVTHETGHVLGLVDKSQARHDTKYGFSGHCYNDCTVQANNGPSDMKKATERLAQRIATAGFCVDCLQDLHHFGDSL